MIDIALELTAPAMRRCQFEERPATGSGMLSPFCGRLLGLHFTVLASLDQGTILNRAGCARLRSAFSVKVSLD